MRCDSLKILPILPMVVVSNLVASQDQASIVAPRAMKSQELLATTASTSLWTHEKRQLHAGDQFSINLQQSPDIILPPVSINLEVVTASTATQSPSSPGCLLAGEVSQAGKDQKRQILTQNPETSAQGILFSPTTPASALPSPLRSEQQVTAAPARPIVGCTTTVMGNLRNPCLHRSEWTSTITDYITVDCHGCPEIHVLEPKWHCPVALSSGNGLLTASGPFTLTSTICASASASSQLVKESEVPALTLRKHNHPSVIASE